MYPDIQNLEEFGIDKNLDVRLKTTKQEYIKSVQDQINICCNMIPAHLCFENYCYLNNLSPYDFKKEKFSYNYYNLCAVRHHNILHIYFL